MESLCPFPPLHHTARACAPAQRPPPSSTLDLPRLLPATHASCLSACTRLLNLRVSVKSNTQGPILVPLPSPPTHHSSPSARPHQYARPSAPTSPAAHETRSPRAIGARRSATTHGLSTPDTPHPSPLQKHVPAPGWQRVLRLGRQPVVRPGGRCRRQPGRGRGAGRICRVRVTAYSP